MSQTVAPVSTPRRIPRIAPISSSIVFPPPAECLRRSNPNQPGGASNGRNGAPIAHLRVGQSRNGNGIAVTGRRPADSFVELATARSKARRGIGADGLATERAPPCCSRPTGRAWKTGRTRHLGFWQSPRAARNERARPQFGPPPSEAERSSDHFWSPAVRQRARRVPETGRSITPSLSYAQNNRVLMAPMWRLMRVNHARGCRRRMPSGHRPGVHDRCEIPGRIKTR
jgi:hypothetical protein